MMKNPFLAFLSSIFFITANAQMDTSHYVINCAFDDGFLQCENLVYTFLDKSNEPRTPEFKIRSCEWPLSIDGETCYLDADAFFIAEIDGKYGCMNMLGEVLIPFKYGNVVESEEDRYFVQKNKKWYEITFKNNKLSKELLDYDLVADPYLEVTVFVKDKEVFFSQKGAELVQSYDGDYQSTYFEVGNDCKYGIASVSGTLLVKPIYDQIIMKDQCISVYKNGKCALYLPEKGEVTEMKYDQIESVPGNRILSYSIDGKEGLMSLEGEELTGPLYNMIFAYGDSLMLAKKEGKYGFVDRHGRESVPFIYKELSGFKNGLSGAKMDGKWGFINEAGEVVIDFQFDDYNGRYYFHEYDKAEVRMDGACFYINRKGERLEDVACR